jgi:hypothetical protein
LSELDADKSHFVYIDDQLADFYFHRTMLNMPLIYLMDTFSTYSELHSDKFLGGSRNITGPFQRMEGMLGATRTIVYIINSVFYSTRKELLICLAESLLRESDT